VEPVNIKIPFWVAVLINANIVIGSAFFLGAGKISATSGVLAPFAWLICGLMLFPLVAVLARLSIHFPLAGGIYVYSKHCLGSMWGFISGWGYFIGTVAGNAVVMHAFSKQLQKIDAVAYGLNVIGLSGVRCDILLVLIFTFLNLLNVAFLERAQILFALLKAIPLLIILVSVPFLFDSSHFVTTKLNWMGFFETIPLVLFAYVGIEACCAVADKIENGHRNAARVIFISFLLITIIYTVLQLALLCVFGGKKADAFLSIVPSLTSNPFLIEWGNRLIYSGLLSSFLAGFYGMFYYNNWNLYAIGREKSIVGWNYLTKLNNNQTPWVCVFVQSALVILFLLLFTKSRYLVTMGDFATTTAYILSVISFLTLRKSFLGILALMSSLVLFGIITKGLFSAGIYYVVPFLFILGLGIIAHVLSAYKEH